MEWVETTAKTVEEAKELALDQLGVDVAEAEFETIEEPKNGLFGRTRGTARVRARVVPLTPRAKTERRRRGKKTDSTPAERAGATKKANTGSRSNGQSKASAAPATTTDDTDTDTDAAPAADKPRTKRHTPQNKTSTESAPESSREPMDDDEQIQVLETFLTELATSFGLTATPESSLVDGELRVNLTGESLGLLVGPRLATLDSVQEIARNTLQRQAAGREYAKVIVDVAGIRERRRTALTEFVTDAATKVSDDDAVVVFEVMSSSDRKQVHDVAAEIDGIRSVSEGEDPRRRVVLRKD